MYTKTHGETLYRQIYHHYKEIILNKELPAFSKLPSVRTYAQKHGLSKTTVEKAYHQLQIEGYIKSQPKSGYYVLPLDSTPPKGQIRSDTRMLSPQYKNLHQQPDSFDMRPLRRAFQEVMHSSLPALFTAPLPEGERPLREAIHLHLKEERGVVTTADHLLIASGVQNHLMVLASLIKERRVAYITPLFDRAELAFDTLGFQRIPCENMKHMLEAKPDIIYISPSNLYPSGDVVSINDRLQLIDYAKKHDAWIIEDDYNHIFRYNAYQIPSIQGLAKGDHVIYIGSFSRNLIISLRMSYMVLPETLIERYRTQDKFAQTVSKQDQLAVAAYMSDGFYQKHLKKLSALSKRQNDVVLAVLESVPLNPSLHVSGLNSNLHLLIHCDNQATFERVRQKAQKENLYIKSFDNPAHTLLFPYGGLSEEALHQSLTAILT